MTGLEVNVNGAENTTFRAERTIELSAERRSSAKPQRSSLRTMPVLWEGAGICSPGAGGSIPPTGSNRNLRLYAAERNSFAKLSRCGSRL